MNGVDEAECSDLKGDIKEGAPLRRGGHRVRPSRCCVLPQGKEKELNKRGRPSEGVPLRRGLPL